MKDVLDRLWVEHFGEVCSKIESEAERALIRKAAELHGGLAKALDEKQNASLEKYVEVLYEIQSVFSKKAFFKGCELGVAISSCAGL